MIGMDGERLDNTREFLTCVPPNLRASCVPTADPFDRAHGTMLCGKYCSAAYIEYHPGGGLRVRLRARVSHAKPRKYHESQLVGEPGRGYGVVSKDSMFDGYFEARMRLAGIEGVGISSGWDTELTAWVQRDMAMSSLSSEDRRRVRLGRRPVGTR